MPDKKIIMVESCMECPIIKGCKAWKELTPQGRFIMKTSPDAVKILKNYPLKDYTNAENPN